MACDEIRRRIEANFWTATPVTGVLEVDVNVETAGDGARELALVYDRLVRGLAEGVVMATPEGPRRIVVDFRPVTDAATGHSAAPEPAAAPNPAAAPDPAKPPARTVHFTTQSPLHDLVKSRVVRTVIGGLNAALVLEVVAGMWPGATYLQVDYNLSKPLDYFPPGSFSGC